jgi:pimeloyl-ACP methyl ester carboxylesterase
MVDFEVIERQVNVGGVNFNVAEAGSGDPVIVLHGWPDS